MTNVRFLVFAVMAWLVCCVFAGSAWAADPPMPDAVVVNGVVYYKAQPQQTVTYNGVAYYAASACETASASACASSGASACASAGRQGPVRRLFARFRSRRGASTASSCG